MWLGGLTGLATDISESNTVENAIKGSLIDCLDNVCKLKIIRRVFCILIQLSSIILERILWFVSCVVEKEFSNFSLLKDESFHRSGQVCSTKFENPSTFSHLLLNGVAIAYSFV